MSDSPANNMQKPNAWVFAFGLAALEGGDIGDPTAVFGTACRDHDGAAPRGVLLIERLRSVHEFRF
jgi:hypothetical protein